MERDVAPGSGDGHLDVAFAETKLTALVENWESSLEELDCSVPAAQLRALLVVAREEGLNVGRLARVLGASPSATRRLCDRMAAGGLLAGDPAPGSRREAVLCITESGRQLAAWVRDRRRDVLRRAVQPMSAAGRAGLARGLRELSTEGG
jgi:DNA-binding MarR family transcriptional regulator